MSQLSIALLGTPVVRHAGKPVGFRTRKALALLIYLALERGVHRRDRLTALLWPESDESQGRATLRSTLAYLRAALGEDASPRPHLIAERDTLAFDSTSDHDLDTQTLDQAAEQARQTNRH